MTPRYGATEASKATGFTPEYFNTTWERQKGLCAICRIDLHTVARGQCHADHDHVTGHTRGILCAHCNWGLGHFKDNAPFLLAAAEYIITHQVKDLL